MNHDNDTTGEEENASSSSMSKSSSSSTNNAGGGALTTVDPQAASNDLLAQARALRAQADTLREDIDNAKIEKEQKEAAKVQRWIEDLLIRYKDDDNGIELLNTVDQVTDKIMDGRFSQEQIHRIFRNLVETTATRGRGGDDNDDHKCSEIVSILVDAAGKLDCLERDDNPNKRWSGRVERELRHRLFAMEWNIDLDKQDDDDDNDGQSDPVTKPKLLN